MLHAPSLSLQPKSDVSDFGQSTKRLNSGKPEFSCMWGEGTITALPTSWERPAIGGFARGEFSIAAAQTARPGVNAAQRAALAAASVAT
jgi:hypothetical protein